ncbi:hypothetical protein Y032_0351g3241 [Ancylostoma ceylanicum]|uniref:Leishmanolysin-like peptidase n=1 Tax=Ancylostoma ceylanicum TaxID=53326 RepID=A0A016RWR0_9BILA|nr:hypothetical protein Y032_0351g3241 [Ancylostoma ceylanicum]
MVNYFLLALLLPSSVSTCDYQAPSPENLSVAFVEYEKNNRTRRDDPVWDWIRIETEYDYSFYELAEHEQELLKNLIKIARDFFESTLKVKRLSWIQLTPTCKYYKPLGQVGGYTHCVADCENRCGPILVRDRAYFQRCRCYEGPCRTRHRKSGGVLRNADFVLFVAAVDSKSCRAGTAAYASHCEEERFTRRPIAGYVNICPWVLGRKTPDYFTMWGSTIKHELMHALVFSPSLYPFYQAARGAPYSERGVQIVPGVFERVKRKEWETAKGYVWHDVFMIVSPKVREEARKYFNCLDLEGAELENQGGRGNKKGRPVHGSGDLEMADFCPYYTVYRKRSRGRRYDTQCTLSENMNYNRYSLEIFSPSSRCFKLDGGIRVQHEDNTDIWMHTVGCYETKCEQGLLFVKTQKSKFYPCYKRGQPVHVKKIMPGIGTVRTKIVCPSCAEICGEQFCEPERTVYYDIGDSSKHSFFSSIATLLLCLIVYFSISHC